LPIPVISTDRAKRKSTGFCIVEKSFSSTHHEMEFALGRRFSGWHLECTAMSTKYLGETSIFTEEEWI
jgi:cysteinyl-tRNA synthetase